MSMIFQVMPDDLYCILESRLKTSNSLFLKCDQDDVYQANALFFKYYFDISSAIESCLRGIVFEYSKDNRLTLDNFNGFISMYLANI